MLDGYHDVPPGKTAAVVTYLEMRQPPARRDPGPRRGELRLASPVDPTEYRARFREIGGPWLWFSRLRLSGPELHDTLAAPGLEVYWFTEGETVVGLVELDWRHSPDVELVLFGLRPGYEGSGLGSEMMRQTLALVWSRQPRRLWLHTCTLDHPRALAFYQRHGFTAYRRAIEIADDPRLNGILPRDAAPHVPIIE
jgi:GNAT superfamily N-acetyltransferase